MHARSSSQDRSLEVEHETNNLRRSYVNECYNHLTVGILVDRQSQNFLCFVVVTQTNEKLCQVVPEQTSRFVNDSEFQDSLLLHSPQEGVATLLQRALIVVDGFSVVVRLDERLADLARQRSVLRVALQRSLVNLDRLFRLKTKSIDIEAALKHISATKVCADEPPGWPCTLLQAADTSANSVAYQQAP